MHHFDLQSHEPSLYRPCNAGVDPFAFERHRWYLGFSRADVKDTSYRVEETERKRRPAEGRVCQSGVAYRKGESADGAAHIQIRLDKPVALNAIGPEDREIPEVDRLG